MSLDTINRVVSIALKCVADDWGKFAFKKKEERPKFFGETLAKRFQEYLGEGLEDEAKQKELENLMLSVGFYYKDKGRDDGAEGT